MSDTAIQVEGISKQYKIGVAKYRYDSLRDHLRDSITSAFRRNGEAKVDDTILWALRDVSFDIKQGEVVGIIGRNGAGKSTLLKILSRITEPTTGRAKVYGRLASLLEVGTGFHAELTGLENIYLNGAILGMKKAEIDRKLDEIIAFADIEKFMDTPVKRYSSGMYVRLAFAVAAHLEPEILIVDEVLGVGDAAFQKKCLGKMQDVAKEGRTVLFVSHNMQAVSILTSRCIMLSGGRCVGVGSTAEIISQYLREGGTDELTYKGSPFVSEPRVTRVELHTSEPNNIQFHGKPMEIRFEITTPVTIEGTALSVQIFNSFQLPVIHLLTLDSERAMCREPGTYKVVCRIPTVRLYLGRYNLTIHFGGRPGTKKFETIEAVCPFEVVAYGKARDYYWQPDTCVYIEECEWQIDPLDNAGGSYNYNYGGDPRFLEGASNG